MGMLTSGLPTGILVDGVVYDISPDYQTGIRIILAFEDRELTAMEKNLVLLDLLYKEFPHKPDEALRQGIKFLDCGEGAEGGDYEAEESRSYSFAQDERYIYSAVDRVLNGRLSKGELVHWWEFVMAFMDLPEDCMMSKILYYRMQFAKGKLSKEERAVWNKNKEIFELPISITEEDKLKEDIFFTKLAKHC